MKVRELVSVWGWDIDTKKLDHMDEQVERMKESVGELIKLGAEAALALFEMTRETAEFGDQALKAAAKAGITVESYQELAYAAKLADVETSELMQGIKFLNMALADSGAQGAKVQEVLTRIGVATKDASGNARSADAVLKDVADRFKTMPDGAEKSALAIEIFSRRGASLIPLLNQGGDGMNRMAREAHQLGVVLDKETAEQGEEFADGLKRIIAALAGLRNEVAKDLMPVMNELVKGFLDWVKANRQVIASNIKEFVSTLVSVVRMLWDVLKVVAVVLKGLVWAIGGVKNAMILLTVAAAAFIALQLASGIVALIGFMQGLIAVIGQTAVAFWNMELAAAPITGIIYGIMAAIALLILIGQDLYYYFSGEGDSLFGLLMSDTTGMPAGMRAMVAIARGLLGPFGIILNVIDGFRSLMKWYDENKNSLEKAQASDIAHANERARAAGGLDAVSAQGSITAQAMAPTLRDMVGGGGSKNVSVSVSAPVTVQGAAVNELTGAVTAHAVTDSVLRAAKGAFTPAEAGPYTPPVKVSD